MNSPRVALYARYSTDMQRASSIEDQLRLCREHAERMGWTIIDSYADRAVSGASMARPGISALIEDAGRGAFDIVLAEAMDRLSRDQEDIAGLFKRLRFANISIVTIAEGKVEEMHIGLKGTMNALFLKDLAQKTHRGLRGRVEAGRSGGGNAYGYAVLRGFGADGTPITGEREIVAAEADIVRRIFREFSLGKSPRTIAAALNREQIPAPGRNGWGQSTINGNAERGTGILNNELYIGRLVWNRLRYLKDPVTGKRVSRLNPPEKIITIDVPHLRIVDQPLWQAVKDRQAKTHKSTRPDLDRAGTPNKVDGVSVRPGTTPRLGFWSHRRPKHLLTGLMRCGQCGGGFVKVSATLFGCATARNKGICDNRLNIRMDRLEDLVLSGLRDRLMDPAVYDQFLAGYIAERNTILAQRNAQFAGAQAELARIKARQKSLVNALVEGAPTRTITDELIALEAREDGLKAQLSARPISEPSLHPRLANMYREKVAALHEALRDPTIQDEAFTIIRTLIEEVRLVPEAGALRIELRGALAGILSLAMGRDGGVGTARLGSTDVLGAQMKMVAGIGFEPMTFRL